MKPALVLSTSTNSHASRDIQKIKRLFQKHDIDVFETGLSWPRDELYFLDNGQYLYVQTGTVQEEWIYGHFAAYGGTYLQAEDLLITSDRKANLKLKEKTADFLGLSKTHVVPVSSFVPCLEHIAVSANKTFYRSNHLDPFMNLLPKAKKLVTYDHPHLLEEASLLAGKVDYSVISLPLMDAAYAAVGFVESNNVLFIDDRAKQSQEVLLPYVDKVVGVPPLLKTNQFSGSLRCMTNEVPVDKAYVQQQLKKRPLSLELVRSDLPKKFWQKAQYIGW